MDSYIFYGLAIVLLLLSFIKDKKKTKMALPSRGDIIDSHFGHCEYFTVFTVNESEIISQEIVPSPAGCG